MKKLLFATIAVLIVFIGAPALALMGPEPPELDVDFEIIFHEGGSPPLKYDTLAFDTALGWDFEDRDGYECANVAQYDEDGNLLLLVEFEQSKDYLESAAGTVFKINDKDGAEPGDGPYEGFPHRDCGNELHGDPNDSRWAPAGEDHFPHYIQSHVAHPDPVMFYQDGAPWVPLPGMVNTDCDRAYWTPGDEPGEVILWWDEDNPENAHHDGSAPLDCGGGGDEPVAVARGFVAFMASNIGVCIHDDDAPGSHTCSGMTAPAPTSDPTVTVTVTQTQTETVTSTPPPVTVTETETLPPVTETETQTVTPDLCATGGGSQTVTVAACP